MFRHSVRQWCGSFTGTLHQRSAGIARAGLLPGLVVGLVAGSACGHSNRVGPEEKSAKDDAYDSESGAASEGDADDDEEGEGDKAEDDEGDGETPDATDDETNACVPGARDDEDSFAETPAVESPDHWPSLEALQFGAPTLIADTFTLAEGPVWDHCTGQLLFTDVEARKVHTLADDGSIGVYFEPTNFANGLAFDPEGRLLMAEMGGGMGGRIARLDRGLNLEVLIDHNPACGLLNTSDDLAVRSDGTIYFTDPIVSHGGYFGFTLSPRPIYRLKPGTGPGKLIQEGQANLPNGIRLSPDETNLYAVGYLEGRVLRFDVAADGSLSGATPFASGLSAPDSMCVDAAGNLYVGVRGGLQVFRADGSPVTLIPIPSASGTTNCTFGGEDGTTLFITAWTSLWRVDGAPIPGNDWERNREMPCE